MKKLLLLIAGLSLSAGATTYNNLSAALKQVLPAGQKAFKTKVVLTAAQAKTLNGFGDGDFMADDPIDVYYTKDATGKVSGAAIQVMEVLKRWKSYHTWVIGVAPDGKLTGVAMMDLPDHYGQPLAAAGFLKQFPGKPAATLTLGKDFDAVSSATESCRLLTASIKRAAWLATNVPLK